MDYNSKSQLVSTFVKAINKNKYNMNHKLQRKEDQWTKLQKSELIDSILRSYPIDPIRAEEKEDKVKYVFDGVQRSTTLRDFLSDKFKLHDSLPSVIIDGQEYEIAGKKFSQLDEVIKDKINGFEIIIYVFSDCTDSDIKEMFRRQNNGKPLSNTQKRTAIESDEVSNIICTLAEHELFSKILTPAQCKKDVAKDLIRETLMLICTNDEHNFTSFKAKDIDNFSIWYGDNIDTSVTGILMNILNMLDRRIDDKIKIKTTSIPMILYAAYQIDQEGKDFDEFYKVVQNFVNTYDDNEDYKQYSSGGTTSPNSVNGRFNYWKNIITSIKELEA